MEQQNKPKRPSTAKERPSRSRCSSAHRKLNTNSHLDFLENLYGLKKDSRCVPRQVTVFAAESDNLNQNSKRYKNYEQLYEENLHLKKEIHLLKKEVELQRGKTEVFRKKNSQYNKKLNIQFEKELYWGNNNNSSMVMGVKGQYDIIKEKYQEKVLQVETLLKIRQVSDIFQFKTYIDTLEEDNKILKKKLEDATQELRKIEYGTINSQVQQAISANSKWKFQLNQANQDLASKIKSLQRKNQQKTSILAMYEKKIKFLDKLLMQKGNEEHSIRKKMTKMEKERQSLTEKVQTYKEQSQIIMASCEEKMKKMTEISEKQAEIERNTLKKEIQQKMNYIAKLEKEVGFLTTILSYWKPIDEINELVASNALGGDQHNVLLEYSNSLGPPMKFSYKSPQMHIQQDETSSVTQSVFNINRTNIRATAYRRGSNEGKTMLQNHNISDVMTRSITLPKQIQHPKRQRITADKRFSQNGVKCRRINPHQVLDIGETLKYRFIGLEIQIEQIKGFFDYRSDQHDILLTPEEEEWKKQYISMEEVMHILKSEVFGLDETDVHTLSRYLIEDSQEDKVYCDPANEQLRQTVKSIIKNVVGHYEIQKQIERIRKQANDLLKKYQTNLESALKTTAPKGYISKRQLLLLFKGLGIELSEQIQQFIISKLIVKSSKLSALKYSVLFQK